MSSALRTLLSYHQTSHALRAHQSLVHHSSTVADPNYIVAKKPLLSRFFTCPTRNSLDSSSSSTSTSSSIPSLPFHAHAGNAVRATIRRAYDEQSSSHTPPPPSPSHVVPSLFFFRRRKKGLAGLIIKRGEDALFRRSREQQAEEEDDDEQQPFSLPHCAVDCPLQLFLPTLVLQLQHSGRTLGTGGDASSISFTSESPFYAHLLALHSARLPFSSSSSSSSSSCLSSVLPSFSLPSFPTFPFFPSLCPFTSASSASSPTPARHLGDAFDEKNNDHIPLPSHLPSPSSFPPSLTQAGSTYTGLCDERGQQGVGVMVYACGDRYEGGWKDGVYEGYGVMEYEGVGVYRGVWRGGVREGKGEWEGVEGERYEGEWVAGVREGQGREWVGEAAVYSGGWVGNERSGRGVAWFEGGVEYEGEWRGGVMHGQGRVRSGTGVEWEGSWVKGLPEQWQVSEKMGEGLKVEGEEVRLTTGASEGGVELLQLLSQVMELQAQLQAKMSKVEQLLVTPKLTAGMDMHQPLIAAA